MAYARRHGARGLRADVLAGNAGMTRVFERGDHSLQATTEAGVAELTMLFSTAPAALSPRRAARALTLAAPLSQTAREAIVLSQSRLAVLAGTALLSVGAGAYAAGAANRAPAQPVRQVLAQAVDPAGAHGRTLALSRVTIPAHARLALHRHPGVQIAYIQKGTLTYTVKTRAVTVYRGPADDDPRVVRRITAGHTGPVHAGEWVIERPATVHSGANEGDGPLVILLATLFGNGRPPSIPVGDR